MPWRGRGTRGGADGGRVSGRAGTSAGSSSSSSGSPPISRLVPARDWRHCAPLNSKLPKSRPPPQALSHRIILEIGLGGDVDRLHRLPHAAAVPAHACGCQMGPGIKRCAASRRPPISPLLSQAIPPALPSRRPTPAPQPLTPSRPGWRPRCGRGRGPAPLRLPGSGCPHTGPAGRAGRARCADS